MKKTLLFLLVVAAMLGCTKEGINNENNNGNGGDGGNDPTGSVLIAFDKEQYYPFDTVTVQFPEPVQEESCTGSIGGVEIAVQNFSEAGFTFELPDLPAGRHTLSLEIGARRAEDNLQVIALPTVGDAEEVFGDMESHFDGVLEQVQESYSPDAPLVTELMDVFRQEVAKMSTVEKQRFAAYLMEHPELTTDWEAMAETRARTMLATRASTEVERMEQLFVDVLKWSTTTAALKLSVAALGVSVVTYTPSPWSTAFIAVSALSTISCKFMSERYGKRALESVAFPHQMGFNGKWSPVYTRAGSEYDFTINADEVTTFDIQMRYRSVSAEDISDPQAPPVARDMVATGDSFSSVWTELDGYIDALRRYIRSLSPLEKAIPDISSITSPRTEDETYDGHLSVEIVQNKELVGAAWMDGRTFQFYTSSQRDVEFTFKLIANWTESIEFTGLMLTQYDPNWLLGTWKNDYASAFGHSATEYLTFREDGTVAYAFNWNHTEFGTAQQYRSNGTYTYTFPHRVTEGEMSLRGRRWANDKYDYTFDFHSFWLPVDDDFDTVVVSTSASTYRFTRVK